MISYEKARDEAADITANCRYGKQVWANMTEWRLFHEGYIHGADWEHARAVEYIKALDIVIESDEKEITELKRKLDIAVETLKFYAEPMNYSVDYDTSMMGVSRRVILYSDQEERNEATSIAGRRARETLAKISSEEKL
jgi:hypothetical protein